MVKATPEEIVAKFKDNLLKIDGTISHYLFYIERAIEICSSALSGLREFVNHYHFKNREEEVHFFEVIKHYGLSEYLFHSKLVEIDGKQPVISIRTRKTHLKRTISISQFFFNETSKFYHYRRIRLKHLDDKYFVRTNKMKLLNLLFRIDIIIIITLILFTAVCSIKISP